MQVFLSKSVLIVYLGSHLIGPLNLNTLIEHLLRAIVHQDVVPSEALLAAQHLDRGVPASSHLSPDHTITCGRIKVLVQETS